MRKDSPRMRGSVFGFVAAALVLFPVLWATSMASQPSQVSEDEVKKLILDSRPDPIRGDGGPCSDSRKQEPRDPFPKASQVLKIVPTAAIAKQATLKAAWSCAGGIAEVLEFSSGVRVTYQSGFDDVNPATKWPNFVEQNGGRVSEVGGVTTYVGTNSPNYPQPFIEAIVDGSLVQVIGAQDSVQADLEEILLSIVEQSRKPGN